MFSHLLVQANYPHQNEKKDELYNCQYGPCLRPYNSNSLVILYIHLYSVAVKAMIR